MNEWAGGFSGTLVNLDDVLEREFEDRLRESTVLAFRVAYGVLRNRQDAEDVAQDAFAKAHRSFTQLRDRDRFRAWLVRLTWRLAIDRWRSDRRRTIREQSVEMRAVATTEDVAVARERSA
ncbi:MAG: RNA polymerase sigma factor, partial [Acidobacteriota bacterium]|nr:RNA polymerase sigma factor [Acidobacteriota bacterium]